MNPPRFEKRSPSSPTPVFPVSVRVPPGGGSGELILRPGEIVVELGRFSLSTRKHFTHTDPAIVLVTSRLLPPWMNTTLIVVDDASGETAYAITWIVARRKLRAAIRAAGFSVVERPTWLSQRPGPRPLWRTLLGLGDPPNRH